MKVVKCNNCGAEMLKNTIICPNCKQRCLSDKKRKTAIVLAFCAGVLGAHNFYLGFYDRAGLEIGISALGVLFIILGLTQSFNFFWIMGIVVIGLVLLAGIIEGILIIRKTINRDHLGKGWHK